MAHGIHIKNYITCNPPDVDCTDQYQNKITPCYWEDTNAGFSVRKYNNTNHALNFGASMILLILFVGCLGTLGTKKIVVTEQEMTPA